jgi:hypothetical protein
LYLDKGYVTIYLILINMLNDSLIIKSMRMRWEGHVARMGEKRNAYRLLVGKRPLERPKHRWVNNIGMDLGEVGRGDVDWMAKDKNRWRALVYSVLNLRVP